MFSFFVCSSFQCSWVLPLECDNNFSLCKQAKKNTETTTKHFYQNHQQLETKAKATVQKSRGYARERSFRALWLKKKMFQTSAGNTSILNWQEYPRGRKKFPLPLLLDSSTTSCLLSLFLDCLPLTLQLCALLLKILSHA